MCLCFSWFHVVPDIPIYLDFHPFFLHSDCSYGAWSSWSSFKGHLLWQFCPALFPPKKSAFLLIPNQLFAAGPWLRVPPRAAGDSRPATARRLGEQSPPQAPAPTTPPSSSAVSPLADRQNTWQHPPHHRSHRLAGDQDRGSSPGFQTQNSFGISMNMIMIIVVKINLS